MDDSDSNLVSVAIGRESLGDLSRLPLSERCDRLTELFDRDLALSAGPLDLASTTAANKAAVRRLAWAVAFNIVGEKGSANEPEPSARQRVGCYLDRWPERTPWTVVQASLLKTDGSTEPAEPLLAELARSVACEQRDDWQHPAFRPINPADAERAFSVLYARDHEKVAGYLRKSFGDRAGDPDALASEAWARVFCEHWSHDAFKRFLGLCRIATLVCQVGRYVALDVLREQNASRGESLDASTMTDEGRACEERFGVTVDPSDALAEAELRRAIERGLQGLPARQALVAEMIWFRGMQAKDVAGVLNISEPAVSQHLKKAREAMGQVLQDAGFTC